jgi:hypothetical protein
MRASQARNTSFVLVFSSKIFHRGASIAGMQRKPMVASISRQSRHHGRIDFTNVAVNIWTIRIVS